MRVAILHPVWWPEVRRGGERLTHELASWLTAAGHDVTLLTTHRGATTESVDDGFAVVRSYVDQAERAGPLTGKALSEVRGHLDKAEALAAKGTDQSVLDQLANASRKSGAAPESDLALAIAALAGTFS